MVGDKSVRDAAKALTSFFLKDWLPHFSNVTDLRDYSRVEMLHEFIDWMFDRANRGELPDLRVIRHQGAQTVIDSIKEGVVEQCVNKK